MNSKYKRYFTLLYCINLMLMKLDTVHIRDGRNDEIQYGV